MTDEPTRKRIVDLGDGTSITIVEKTIKLPGSVPMTKGMLRSLRDDMDHMLRAHHRSDKPQR